MQPSPAALAAILLLLAACGGKSSNGSPAPAATTTTPAGEPREEEPEREDLLAAEIAAFERARPVFDRYCTKCHSKDGAKAKPKTLGHLDMTDYPFGGHHAEEISSEIRKALAIGGGEPTMPLDDPGAVKGDELALIAAWADAYDRVHQSGAHGDRGHGADHQHGGHEH
jgi:uncharacterized membrane protein